MKKAKPKMKTKMKTDDKLVHVIEEQLLRVRKTDETEEEEEEEYTVYCTQVAQAATVLQESGATRLAWTAVDILPLSMPGEMMVINLKLSTEARRSTESWRTSMTLISSRLET